MISQIKENKIHDFHPSPSQLLKIPSDKEERVLRRVHSSHANASANARAIKTSVNGTWRRCKKKENFLLLRTPCTCVCFTIFQVTQAQMWHKPQMVFACVACNTCVTGVNVIALTSACLLWTHILTKVKQKKGEAVAAWPRPARGASSSVEPPCHPTRTLGICWKQLQFNITKLNMGLINKGWYGMFVACGIWCLADVSSVSPSSEQTGELWANQCLNSWQ